MHGDEQRSPCTFLIRKVQFSCSMKAEDPEASEEIEPQSHHIDLEKLENARYTNEMALHKWQALIVLENEAGAYRTIPLPYILSREVQSLASLAESLILISTYCEREEILSLRNENVEDLRSEARRLATIALSLATKHKDNFGEGKCYAALGKLAYSRNSMVMANRFFEFAIEALEQVIKHDAAYFLLMRDVRNRLTAVQRGLTRRKSMMGSFKILSHNKIRSKEVVRGSDESNMTEGELREIFEKHVDPENGTVDSASLSAILTELGCYPNLKEDELSLLKSQINLSSGEDVVDFMAFWMWWVKSEPIKKR